MWDVWKAVGDICLTLTLSLEAIPCNIAISDIQLKTTFFGYISTADRACERSVSGAENGAERPENLVERSGAVSGHDGSKNGRAERSAEREVAEREWSVERAELAAHSPLRRSLIFQ